MTPATAVAVISAIALSLIGPLAGHATAAEGQLAITVVDEKTHQPIACRMHLVGPNKRPRKAEGMPFWADHFVFPGKLTLKLPLGNYTFEIQRGLEYLNREGYFTIDRFADDSKQVELRRFCDMTTEGWWSGDLYVRRPVRDAELLMSADDLHVAQVITWWNDARFVVPASAGSGQPLASRDPLKRALQNGPFRAEDRIQRPLVTFDRNRCYDIVAGGWSRAGSELLCFHLPAPLPLSADDPESPPTIAALLKARSETKSLWIDVAAPYSWDLPLLAAHGLVDSVQVAHSHFCRDKVLVDEAGGRPRDPQQYPHVSGYARWSQDVYFRLLECGLRIPPSAGSGSGVTPNPVGYNRMYVHLEGSFDYDQWWKNLRAGQVVVTNGPLLRPTVEGQLPGHVFQGEDGKELELEIGLTLSTADPISYLDVIQDGQVRDSIRFEDYAKTGRLPKIMFKRSGWFALRAVTDTPKTYRFALTGPYYIEFGGQRRISRRAAQFFLDWVYQRARQIKIEDPRQQREVLEYHRQARDYWRGLVAKANAE